MAIFWTLSPFVTFTALMWLAPSAVALLAAASISTVLIAVDLWSGRSLKQLQVGSALLFAALGAYVALLDSRLGNTAVRATIDGGLLLFALGSLALRRPFTKQYARENVTPDVAKTDGFHRANVVITSVWAGAFVLMIVADLCAIYLPSLPLWTGVIIAFLARNGAVYFGQWYSAQQRAKFASATGAPTVQGMGR